MLLRYALLPATRPPAGCCCYWLPVRWCAAPLLLKAFQRLMALLAAAILIFSADYSRRVAAAASVAKVIQRCWLLPGWDGCSVARHDSASWDSSWCHIGEVFGYKISAGCFDGEEWWLRLLALVDIVASCCSWTPHDVAAKGCCDFGRHVRCWPPAWRYATGCCLSRRCCCLLHMRLIFCCCCRYLLQLYRLFRHGMAAAIDCRYAAAALFATLPGHCCRQLILALKIGWQISAETIMAFSSIHTDISCHLYYFALIWYLLPGFAFY